MRFSAVAALCAAPLALASSLQADLVARGALNAEKRNTVIVQESGNGGSSTEVIVIWVNNGGAGQPTQTINSALSTISSTAVASAATHTVTVGGTAGLVYSPDTVAAAVGDMIEFQFQSQNHTVTQSAFAEPCVKLATGMDSGFMPNINNSLSANPPKMAMQVTVATPLWFYCRQVGHCGKGMVFSVNPNNGTDGNKTAAAFQALAIQQNGTGSTAVIAGGTGASSSAAPVSLASTTASAAGTASTAGSGLTSGSGTLNSNGACACSCLCGTAAFPNAAVQGIGAFGGMSGAMPMSALEVSVTTS